MAVRNRVWVDLDPLDPNNFAETTSWFRADNVTFGAAPVITSVDGLHVGEPVAANVFTGSPEQVVTEGVEGILLSDADSDILSYGASSNDNASLFGATNWHAFIIFRIDAVTLTSANVYQNHGIVANVNASRYWGFYARLNAGQPELNGYVWDGSQKFTQNPIVIGKVHLAEMWHDGTTLRSRVDGGPISSAAAGAISDLTRIVRWGPGSNFDGVIYEAVTMNGNIDADPDLAGLRTYFWQRYYALGVRV